MTQNEKEKALEHLSEAIYECMQADITIGVGKMFGSKATWTIFLGNEVDFDNPRFVLKENR